MRKAVRAAISEHKLPNLHDLVLGRTPGRTAPQQVTCFLNYVGLGYQFAAVGRCFTARRSNRASAATCRPTGSPKTSIRSMAHPIQLGAFPRYAIGVLSPLAGVRHDALWLHRLLGPDFIVISTSLALASFKPEDIERAVAAIDDESWRIWSRAAPSLILQSGTPLALSLGPEARAPASRLRERSGLPVRLLGAQRSRCRAALQVETARGRQQVERHHQPGSSRLSSPLGHRS